MKSSNTQSISEKIKILSVVGMLSVSISACAEMPGKYGSHSDRYPSKPAGTTSDSGHDTGKMPINITFKNNGQPVIVDDNGNIIEGKPVEFPVRSRSIVSVQTFSVIQVVGSHFVIIDMAGNPLRFDLPAPHPVQ